MVKQFKEADSIIDHFKSAYKKKFGRSPVVNRTKAKYQLLDVLKDLSVKEVLRLISFYVKHDMDPTIKDFCLTYDELQVDLEAHDRYRAERQRLLKETEKRTEEFRKRYGNDQ